MDNYWRSFCSSLVNEINELKDISLAYHKNEDRDEDLEEDIISRLDNIELKFEILNRNIKNIELSDVKELRRSITLSNFQTSKHDKKERSSELSKNIIAISNKNIDMIYNALFPNK